MPGKAGADPPEPVIGSSGAGLHDEEWGLHPGSSFAAWRRSGKRSGLRSRSIGRSPQTRAGEDPAQVI